MVLNPGAGGDTAAADDVGGIKYQIVKIDVGGDGVSAPLSTSNPIPVSDAGGSITVDGTVAATQSGTWNVGTLSTITNVVHIDDNAGSITVDGTVAISGTVAVTDNSGSLTVDNGGTFSVQAGQVAHDAPASGNPVVVAGVASAAAPTSVSGDGDAVQAWYLRNGAQATVLTAAGALIGGDATNGIDVDVTRVTGTVTVGGVAATDAAVSGNPVYVAGRGSNTTPTAMSAQNDVTPLWLTLNGAVVVSGDLLDDAAFTPGTSRVQAVGYTADETATDSVDEGDLGAARMTLDRKQIFTPYVHAAAGGHTPYKNLDVDETEDDIKTSAGKLFWLHAMNLTASVVYLKIYNSIAASVTVGTTVPDLTFPLPTMADTNGAGFAINFGDAGMQFTTGICIAATTGLADNNAGAPAANAVVVNAGYL